MYKVSSQKAQSAAHRGRYADWVSAGPELRSLEVEREDLRRAAANIEVRIGASEDKDERKRLGLEKLALQNELSGIGKQIRAKRPPGSVEQCFVSAAKERLSEHQFKSLMLEAERRAEQVGIQEQQIG